jgi:hypothetical protein
MLTVQNAFYLTLIKVTLSVIDRWFLSDYKGQGAASSNLEKRYLLNEGCFKYLMMLKRAR